jgi:hypothetical protein
LMVSPSRSGYSLSLERRPGCESKAVPFVDPRSDITIWAAGNLITINLHVIYESYGLVFKYKPSMIRADEVWTKQVVTTTAESETGFLGLEQRDAATTGRNFIQSNSYTRTVSDIVKEEENRPP